MTEFLNIISTKRSGHHAFIDWILAQAPDAVFVNNRPLPRAEADMRAARDGRLHIVNFEGITPHGVARVQAAERGSRREVVFLRDPLNTVASLIRRKARPVAEVVMLCQQLFALRDWLERRRGPGEEVHISYNAWLLDPGYRQTAAERLGLPGADLPEAVTAPGGGSSFGGPARVDEAGRAARLQRWRNLADHPAFNAMIGHEAVRDTFEAACAGDLVDALGADFRDDDAALHLRRLRSERTPGPRLLHRAVSRLWERRALYRDLEAATGLARKAHVWRATLASLA